MVSKSECPMCLDEYSRTQMPMLFPCGHAICKRCFDLTIKNNRIQCPIDRSTSNVRNLSPAYDLMSTIEQLQVLKPQINQEFKPKVDSQSHDNSKTEISEKQFNEKFKEFEEKCKESTEKMIAEIKREEEEERRIKFIEQMN